MPQGYLSQFLILTCTGAHLLTAACCELVAAPYQCGATLQHLPSALVLHGYATQLQTEIYEINGVKLNLRND